MPVAQIRKGKVVSIYESTARTADDGFDPATVRKVINGTRNHHLGATFKQINKTQLRKITSSKGEGFGKISRNTINKIGLNI